MIAALYVQANGIYFGLPDVDPWPEQRDARLYAGPHRVVAHPPCAAWCVLSTLREKVHGLPRGEDGGCFAAALASVRRWGGVLEHPAGSFAFRRFGLPEPIWGGWQRDFEGGWVCEVHQSAYGHPATKRTWLYAFGVEPQPLLWTSPPATTAIRTGMAGGRAGSRADQRAHRRPRGLRSGLGECDSGGLPRRPPRYRSRLTHNAPIRPTRSPSSGVNGLNGVSLPSYTKRTASNSSRVVGVTSPR